MIADLQCVVLDCSHPEQLADFYQAILGGVVNQQDQRWGLSDDWATLHTPAGLVLVSWRSSGWWTTGHHSGPIRPDPSSSTSTSVSPT